MAGPGCPQDNTRRFTALATVAGVSTSGGWTGDGCTGRLELIALPNGPGVDTLASWSFDVGSGVSSCDVSIYVPQSADPADVASYRIQAGGSSDGLVVVRNAGNAGRWVRGGTFAVRGSVIKIYLLDRQGGPRPPARYATQVKLDC